MPPVAMASKSRLVEVVDDQEIRVYQDRRRTNQATLIEIAFHARVPEPSLCVCLAVLLVGYSLKRVCWGERYESCRLGMGRRRSHESIAGG
jgi:hypothetical protein